jgi:type IV secretory pathway VirB3-like protein
MKVRRSLLNRDLLAGVPQAGLVLIFVLSVLFLYLFRMYFMAAPIAALYAIMRHMTSKDPWFIEIVMDNIQQKDVFIP